MQVFLSIISYFIKSTPKGKVEVRVEAIKQEGRTEIVKINVTNSERSLELDDSDISKVQIDLQERKEESKTNHCEFNLGLRTSSEIVKLLGEN